METSVHGRMRGLGWLALGVLAFRAPALACSLAADPSVLIEPASGGTVDRRDPCTGITYITVDEGSEVTLGAKSVSKDSSCRIQPDWNDVMGLGGGWLKLNEVFGRGAPGPVQAEAFLRFLLGGGTDTGSPNNTFRFSVSPTNIVNPSSGDISSFEAMFNDALALGGASSPYRVKSFNGLSGKFRGRGDLVEVHWQKLPDASFDMPANFKPLLPPGPVGLNPQVTPGPRLLNVNDTLKVTFDTPSFRGDTAPDSPRYAIYAEGAIPYEMGSGGNQAKVEVTVCEKLPPPPPATPPPSPPPPDCGPDIDVTVTLTGMVVKRSKPSGVAVDGTEGHPSIALIAVRDKTQVLGAKITPDTLATVKTGSPPPSDAITIEAVDNNPYGTPADYEARAWALIERSSWEHRDDFKGDFHEDVAHGLFADDCWAASPGHQFRWVELTGSPATPAVQRIDVGGFPAGDKLTFTGLTIPTAENTGTHWATGMQAIDSGKFHDYVDKGLKIVYQVTDKKNGKRPAMEPTNTPPPELNVVEDWGGKEQLDYKTGGGAIPPPIRLAVQPLRADVHQATLTAGCPDCGAYDIVGLPTWQVEDNLPPSLVLVAVDEKYQKTYYFGENFSADAHGNEDYQAAFVGAQAGNPEDPNPPISPYSGGTEWNQNSDPAGYTKQIGGYQTTFFPVSANVDPPADPEYAGLWIDEDTKVTFEVEAWDNIEGWDHAGNKGIPTLTAKLTDGPGGSTMDIPRGGTKTYLFRNPNKPDGVPGGSPAFVEAQACDKANNCRSMKVQIYIADNSLKIYSLEENRRRLSN